MPNLIEKRLVGVRPWSESGPGWANQGVTLTWEWHEITDKTLETKREDEWFYTKDLPELWPWIQVGLIARQAILRIVEREETKKEAKVCA